MKIVTEYLHFDGESIDKDLNLTEQQRKNLIDALYEVKFEIDADTGRILFIRSGQQELRIDNLDS